MNTSRNDSPHGNAQPTTPMDTPPLIIAIQPRTVYGRTYYYPACPKAQTFADMVGQSTLTKQNLQHILRLGVEITYIHEHQEVTL